MKPFVTLILLLILVLPTETEAGQPRRLEHARGEHVALIDADNREWRGRLLEVAKDAVTVEVESSARRFRMDEVKRVDAEGDPVWDGAIKGALMGALVGGLVATNARQVAGSMLIYTLLGTGIDAMHRCRHTVYRAPAPSIRLKVASW